MACEKPPLSCSVMQMNLCQICGNNMQSCGGQQEVVNYHKLVDCPRARTGPRPPLYIYQVKEPTIVHTGTVEYRVTSQVLGKDANQSGVTYIMNHGFMDRADVETWVEKKKRMAKENISWVGDGTYQEVRPQMLHCFGNTTHLFLKNPDKPYGNSPRPLPVCKPRNGLDN